MRRALVMAFCATVLLGCSDELDPTSLLNQPRVLGAFASVEGDEERTNPRPGETVVVDWLLAFPEARLPATYALIACEPADISIGVDFCQSEELLTLAIQVDPTSDAPRIVVEVPEDYTNDRILVQGAICMGGVVNQDVDFETSTMLEICRDNVGEGQLVSLIQLVDQTGRFENRAPGIAELRFGGEVWTAPVPDDVTAGCDGLDLPTVSVDGDDVPIVIRMEEGSRETFIDLEGDPLMEVDAIESLQNSILITAGELERTFTFIEGDDVETEVDYTPIQSDDEFDVPPGGRVVKFLVVMRDLRGGLDFEQRALCVMP
ncbi:MAG: hypothetical protein AAGE52_05900 [Myxococcota bacterium]